MIGRFVEVLQRLHALVPRARRRVAVIQNRLQQILAFRIVSAEREIAVSHVIYLVRSNRTRLQQRTLSQTYLQDV